MKKMQKGGVNPAKKKARLEKRANRVMSRAQKTYAESLGAIEDAKKSGTKADVGGAEQLQNRSLRQEARAKKIKAKASTMKNGGVKKPLRKAQKGEPVYSGPLNKFESNSIDSWNNSSSVKNKARQAMLNPKYTRDQALEKGMDARSDEDYDLMNKGITYASGKMKPGPFIDPRTKKKGGAVKKRKTGGMVNTNVKASVLKKAGTNGVKSGINPKAKASKVAKGRVGGTSTAPKKATPGKK
jgi:hypothetical protein